MKNEFNILISHFRPDIISGAEFAIADMINARSNRFHYIILAPGEGNLAEFYKSHGYDVWTQKVQTRRRLYPGLHTVQSRLFASKLKERSIDMVICNTFPAASRVGTACRIAGIPYGIYVREYISDRPLHRKILAKADKILAVSKDVQNYLGRMVDPDKIIVAYDHINADPILKRVALHKAKGARTIPFDFEHQVIGIIGRITRYKQQDLFIRSIPNIIKEVSTARFVIVGTAQPKEMDYEESLKKLAFELGLQDKVVFMGHRKDAIEIISELTICCLTSDREPFPRSVLEAQLVGCPVIAADTGGCPEMVEDGVTGMLFSSISEKSVEQLSNSVVRLLKDPVLTSKIIINAKERVLNTVASKYPVKQLEKIVVKMQKSGEN